MDLWFIRNFLKYVLDCMTVCVYTIKFDSTVKSYWVTVLTVQVIELFTANYQCVFTAKSFLFFAPWLIHSRSGRDRSFQWFLSLSRNLIRNASNREPQNVSGCYCFCTGLDVPLITKTVVESIRGKVRNLSSFTPVSLSKCPLLLVEESFVERHL